MGKRSRKRGATIAPPPTATPAPRRADAPVSTRARMSEAPKAPWSPVPLTELVILLALVVLAIGFFSSGDRRGTLIGVGLVLASLGGGELALREHFAGYRSHTTLLAMLCGFVAGAVVWLAGASSQGAIVVVAIVVAVATFPLLRRAFRRRSGGLGFRA